MDEFTVESIGERLNRDPNVVALIGAIMPMQIGVTSFLAFFEHEHFPLATEREDLFEPYTIHWDGMELILLVIPKEYLPKAVPILTKLGLRYESGVPDSINGARFPFTAPNAYTIEYVPGHFAYRKNDEEIRAALRAEQESLRRHFKNLKKKK